MDVMIENKVVPKLRFREFKDDWINLSLGELLTFKNGLNSDKDKYGSGVRFINVLDIIENNFITYDKIIGSVEVTKKEFDKNEVVYGDILFQRSSETREDVGQSNVYLDKNKSAVFGGFVIRGHSKKVYEPVFMNYLLKTWLVRKEITTKSGGSTRYNVGQDALSKVVIFSTSISEQKKIASFLSVVDEKLQKLTKKKELLSAYKKGVMQRIFSQELCFKDDNGNNYPDWEEKKLGELCDITTGKSNREDSSLDGVYTFFDRSEDIRTSSIYLFDGEAVIVAGEGSSFPPKYFKGKFDLHQRTYAIMGFKNLFGRYLFYYLHQYKNYFVRYAVGSTVKSLRLPIFNKMNIRLPSLEEQKKIANFLSSLDSKIELVSTQIENTKAFKKGLLQQMFV